MIIDAHTHFYDPHRPQGVPWPNKEDGAITGPYCRSTTEQWPNPPAAVAP